MYALSNDPAECRYVRLPACDPQGETSQGADIPAAGLFYLRQRDVLDFGLDLTDWIGANHNPKITDVVWSVAANSPKQPVLGGSAFDEAGRVTVVASCGQNALPGDTYYLEATISLGAVAASQGVPAIPARTIVRRIVIIATKG